MTLNDRIATTYFIQHFSELDNEVRRHPYMANYSHSSLAFSDEQIVYKYAGWVTLT